MSRLVLDPPSGAALAPLVEVPRAPKPVELLRAELRAVCGLFSVEPRPRARGSVTGSVGARLIGGVESAVVSLDAESVTRDARAIRAEGGEHLFLIIQDEGHCRILQRGLVTDLAPGDMYLADSAHPSEFIYPDQATQLSLHLPRRAMIARFGEVCAKGVAIARDDPLRLAMRAVVVKMLARAPGADLSLGEALLGLLGAYFQCVEDQVPERDRAANAVLSRALALIERHAPDPDFGPAALAARLNVSERTLQRHFQILGETASRRILAVRLESARRRLAGAGADPVAANVAVVAYESGFNDLSYFYREFRAKYGVPPGAIRRDGRALLE